jgi:hypothetical protein
MNFKPINKNNVILGAKMKVDSSELTVIKKALEFYAFHEDTDNIDINLAKCVLDSIVAGEEA